MIQPEHTILFVGLDTDRAGAVSNALTEMGVVPLVAETSPRALALLMHSGSDLIVLDDAIGDVHVLNQKIRQRTHQPLVVLTAADDAALHTSVLADGADDVIVKPYPVLELIARLRALLRRTAWNEPGADEEITYGSVRLDCQKDRLWVQGDWIKLTPVESRVLAYLLKRAGQPVGKSELARAIWGWGKFVEQTEHIDRVIKGLQKKLTSVPGDEPISAIHTFPSIQPAHAEWVVFYVAPTNGHR